MPMDEKMSMYVADEIVQICALNCFEGLLALVLKCSLRLINSLKNPVKALDIQKCILL